MGTRKTCREQARRQIDLGDGFVILFLMTAEAMLDLKHRLAQLSAAERRKISAYLLRLKHESPAGRRKLSQAMREMDEGKKVRLRDLAKQLGYASE